LHQVPPSLRPPRVFLAKLEKGRICATLLGN
jgi:hypothetical protein